MSVCEYEWSVYVCVSMSGVCMFVCVSVSVNLCECESKSVRVYESHLMSFT